MGYEVKIQKVERPTNRSYYVNLLAAIAVALNVKKAEVFEWTIENKDTLVLSRKKKSRARKLKSLG